VTPERTNAHYNNFCEFGSGKDIAAAAESLKTRPWTLKIDGLAENPQEITIDDLIAAMPLEERLYRHRCVEGWAMAVPWTGFPLLGRVFPWRRCLTGQSRLARPNLSGWKHFWTG
jgi:methionine sulfoxide reductase catalytic subunit